MEPEQMKAELDKIKEQVDRMSTLEEMLTEKTSRITTLEDELRQARNDLKEASKKMESSGGSSGGATSKPLVLVRERKVAKFGGFPVKDTDPDVIVWLSDVRQHINNIDEDAAKVDYIMDHIIGRAKDEVRLTPQSERDSAEKILKIIERIFQDRDTLPQLQEKFFTRNQHDDEDLMKYSLQLSKMFERITKMDPSYIAYGDKVLKDRFVEGVRDHHLRREMRRYCMDHEDITYSELRSQVTKWVTDAEMTNTKTKVRVEETRTTQDMDSALQKIVKQIDQQNQQIKKQGEIFDHFMKTSQQRPSSQQPLESTSTNTPAANADMIKSPMICYRCGKKGHKAYKCRARYPKQFQFPRGSTDAADNEATLSHPNV